METDFKLYRKFFSRKAVDACRKFKMERGESKLSNKKVRAPVKCALTFSQAIWCRLLELGCNSSS